MVKIVVIGCGILGTKIAGALAFDGHQVRVYDNNDQLLNKLYLRLNEDRRILKEDGFMVNSDFLGDVYCFSNLEDAVRGASLVFECIPENLSMKKELFKEIEKYCPKDAIISTSAMKLPINEIFSSLIHQETRKRCLGVRFLYPVYFIPEVELLTSQHTSLETLEKVRSFLEKMNKVAFFRSGNEPIVLSEEQRDARRNAYLRLLQEEKLITTHSSLVPNLFGNFSLNDPKSDSKSNQITDGQENIPPDSNHYNNEKECVVCMDSERNCVLHPCHHLCVCIACGRLLLKRTDACPICRRIISNVFRVYHS